MRAMYGYMFTHPGSKLLFMGGEFGQTKEWSIETGIDWELAEYTPHKTLSKFVADLNKLYRTTTALYELAYNPKGFEWIDIGDHQNSILTYLRRGKKTDDFVVVINNFTPAVHNKYRVGVPTAGTYTCLLNSDSVEYGGTGNCEVADLEAVEAEWNGRAYHVELTVPPLGTVVLAVKSF
jgi:1,4-alpha-glucan branching enzyme